MTAERLRLAATTIRETAGHATDGQWTSHVPRDGHYLADVRTRRDGNLQEGIAYQVNRGADAEYIALMSPPVALAVADWLDYAAEVQARRDKAGVNRYSQALVVADAILGDRA